MCKLDEKDRVQIVTALTESLKSLVHVSEKVRSLEIKVEFEDNVRKKKDLAEGVNDMAQIKEWLKRSNMSGAWLRAAEFFFSIGFASIFAVIPLTIERGPSYLGLMAPGVAAFIIGDIGLRKVNDMTEEKDQQTTSKQP